MESQATPNEWVDYTPDKKIQTIKVTLLNHYYSKQKDIMNIVLGIESRSRRWQISASAYTFIDQLAATHIVYLVHFVIHFVWQCEKKYDGSLHSHSFSLSPLENGRCWFLAKKLREKKKHSKKYEFICETILLLPLMVL